MNSRDDGYDALPADLQALIDRRSATRQAAGMLTDLGITADDILDGLADGGQITILPLGDEDGGRS